jgi:transposase
LVWDFARQQRGLSLECLPAYAPELSPVEYLWTHWKQHKLPNLCPDTYRELLPRRGQPEGLVERFMEAQDGNREQTGS